MELLVQRSRERVEGQGVMMKKFIVGVNLTKEFVCLLRLI